MLTFLTLFGFSSCDSEPDREEYAKMIIRKVERFEIDNNRLPKNVYEIGVTEMEDSPAFYEKTSDSTFIVWYGLSLGESKTYHSETQEWNIGG